MKSLIIYYSLEGSTDLFAKKIAAEIGADLLRLYPKEDVPQKGFMKYAKGGKQAVTKAEPPLKDYDINPLEYDLLLFGTPVWAGTFVPALRTFFSKTKIEGKKVALFCCYRGSAGKSLETMKDILKNNEILGESGFRTIGNQDKNIKKAIEWAKNILPISPFTK